MTDIFSLSLEELAKKINDAQLTSVEVCEKYIERINKFEKDVKALSTVFLNSLKPFRSISGNFVNHSIVKKLLL